MTEVKKRFPMVLIAVLLAVTSMMIAACGGDDDDGDSADGGEEAKNIVFSVYSDEPLFIRSSIKGLEQAAEEKGWEFTALVDDNDPAAQVSQIENALTQQPDGLIVWPNDREAAIPVAQDAAAQGIEVLTMGQDLGDPAARQGYVGPDYVELGRLKAEKLVELMDGDGQLGIIRGIRGADFTENLAEGGDPVFEEAGVEIVDETYAGGYTTEHGLEAAENMITANPDVEAIWTDNDDQAVGVINALTERNLNEVIVVSTNGDPAGLEEVEKGRMAYTQALCGVEDGFIAMDAMEDLFAGEDLPDRVATNVVEITPDNIDQHIDDLEGCN